MEEGFCSRKLEDSMLGLHWSLFRPRRFPEHADDTRFSNPPEFLSLSFSTLDAYATAILAAPFRRAPLGDLTFTCRLKQGQLDSRLQLQFVTIPERGRILPGTAMIELLRSFPDLLRIKDAEASAVYYLEGEGCPMQFAYPGQMIVEVCPFLRDRPLDLWPEVTLTVLPTEELVVRAKTLVEFVRNSASIDGDPN
jgi:hypothetical protein